ncbi:MAG: 4-alpha-glucanotransferase [Gemmatimonadetes bacterium]|nr:4-alpha-glucanotransferase [Gemmatimonadota bacterium]
MTGSRVIDSASGPPPAQSVAASILDQRTAGVLLHPTSLPGLHGIGDFGADAHRFLDFLAEAGCSIWQVLPLGPTGYGDSPYQAFSAFAGNPLLISVSGTVRTWPANTVDYEHVIPYKRALLAAAFEKFKRDDAYDAFVASAAAWLPDFALFMAIKEEQGGIAWTDWPAPLAQRDPAALGEARTRLATPIARVLFEQFAFHRQFERLREAANARGIHLMGDLPIYVAHDSADVWAAPHLFDLKPDGRPRVQAGVPPDYFSATGQLWGNPIYRWDAMRAEGFPWWIARMKAALAQFDCVRLDHFRGFEAYWEVPGDAETAATGRWVKGPGRALFDALTAALGPLPLVAEDLGLITPEVKALREGMHYPGMAILQFAFGNDDSAGDFTPHNLVRDRVLYTGTHDNDTAVGWWTSTGEGDSTRTPEMVAREKAYALRYLNADGTEMHWTLIRAALATVARTCLIPMQDLLGLGSDARMNLPGRPGGNWRFRFQWDQLTPEITARLRSLVDTYDRRPTEGRT